MVVAPTISCNPQSGVCRKPNPSDSRPRGMATKQTETIRPARASSNNASKAAIMDARACSFLLSSTQLDNLAHDVILRDQVKRVLMIPSGDHALLFRRKRM